MLPEMQNPSNKGKPSQNLVRITEIRDGVAILADGTMRSIMMVSSLNFALKSEEEQNAIIYAYQGFINSLDFPVQITVSSRKLDITPYLEEVKAKKEKQKNDLLRLQMDEYINFIDELVKDSSIMSKTFLITIPFAITQSRKENPWNKFFKSLKGATGKHTVSDDEFQHSKAQLYQRVEQVSIGLRGIGLRVAPLQTQELLELFYTMYNPKTSRNQRLRNVGKLKVREMEKEKK